MRAKTKYKGAKLREVWIRADNSKEERDLAQFYLDLRKFGRATLVLESARTK